MQLCWWRREEGGGEGGGEGEEEQREGKTGPSHQGRAQEVNRQQEKRGKRERSKGNGQEGREE